MTTKREARIAVALGAAIVIGALAGGCRQGSSGGGGSGGGGGGGGGGGTPPMAAVQAEVEPNDTTVTATPFTLTQVATGTISASTGTADVDQWSFQANSGALLDLEVYGARNDYASWLAANAAPRLELRAPSGAIVGQVDSRYQFNGPTDVGFRKLYLPESGTYALRVIPFADTSADQGSGRYFFTSGLTTPTLVSTDSAATTATAIALGSGNATAVGFIGNASQFWSVACATNEVLSVEVIASRNVSGNSSGQVGSWDPEINIIAPTGALFAGNVDDGVTLDSTTVRRIPTAGTYFIEVFDIGNVVSGTAYTLEVRHETTMLAVETEPNDTTATAATASPHLLYTGTVTGSTDLDRFRIEVVRGDLVDVAVEDPDEDLNMEFLDASGGSALGFGVVQETGVGVGRFLATSAGAIFVSLAASTSTDYTLRYSRTAHEEETEANDTTATASVLTPGTAKFGTFSTGGDVDHFAFTAVRDGAYVVTVEANSNVEVAYDSPEGIVSSALLDARVSVIGPDGAEVAPPAQRLPTTGNDTSALSLSDPAHHAQAAFVAGSDGTHVIRLESPSGASGANVIYTVKVERK